MRIRSIRPEFWSSEDVAAMDWHTRLIFIGLWSYVDDNGVGRDVHRLILASLFPLDDDLSESSRRLAAGISTLAEGGQVVRYEVEGRPYLHIAAWAKNQRTDNAGKQRFPLPTCEDAVLTASDGTGVGVLAATRGDSRLGEGEKGRRGEGEKVSSPTGVGGPPDRFEEFWTAYGHKLKRADAEKCWAKAIRKAEPDRIIAAAVDYVAHVKADKAARGDRATEQAHASSWLNGERWNDERSNVHPITQAATKPRYPHARELELPPDGLSPREYADWDRAQREKRGSS